MHEFSPHKGIRSYSRALDRRSPREILVQAEHEQQRALVADVFDAIRRQGPQTLRSTQRRALQEKICTIQKPLVDEKGEFHRLISTSFTISEGTIMSWRGMPTAVAYGTLKDNNGFILLGEAHYPETLTQNGINPRTTDKAHILLGEFPGHFLQSTDALAFVIAPLPDKSKLGIITGDASDESLDGIVVPTVDFADRGKKAEKLNEITEFIGEKIFRKFAQG